MPSPRPPRDRRYRRRQAEKFVIKDKTILLKRLDSCRYICVGAYGVKFSSDIEEVIRDATLSGDMEKNELLAISKYWPILIDPASMRKLLRIGVRRRGPRDRALHRNTNYRYRYCKSVLRRLSESGYSSHDLDGRRISTGELLSRKPRLGHI